MSLCSLVHVPAADGHGLVGSWNPGIGDPDAIGWITTVAYLVTAAACFALGRRRHVLPREHRLWQLLSFAFLALGVNKQLDLQTALTEAARLLAKSQGWYAERRPVQLAFIAGILVVAVVAVAVGVVWTARSSRSARVAVMGFNVIAAFVVLRASSFHHVDVLLGARVQGAKLNAALELGGIFTTLLAALFRRSEITR